MLGVLPRWMLSHAVYSLTLGGSGKPSAPPSVAEDDGRESLAGDTTSGLAQWVDTHCPLDNLNTIYGLLHF